MHAPSAHEIETFTGRFVDTSKPKAKDIVVEDIAHALSQVCRYGGHCRSFYSVATHAVFVSQRLERRGLSTRLVLAGLHHDDAEAYLGDIPRPMKPLLGRSYEVLSNRMDHAIVEGLQLPFDTELFHNSAVKDADNWSLIVEARHLLLSEGRGWLSGEQGAGQWGLNALPSRIVVPDYWRGGQLPTEAEKAYLARHEQLMKELGL